MNAQKLSTFCAVRELSFVEQGVRQGIKGAWFETRKRERRFFTESEVVTFADEVKTQSDRLPVIQSFTS